MPRKGQIRVDLTGRMFGRLRVVRYAFSDHRGVVWECICLCGVEGVLVVGDEMQQSRTLSCGCLRQESSRENGRKSNGAIAHGHTVGGKWTPTYIAWAGMIARVKPTAKLKERELYFARGITVCERWREFGNFFADVGTRPEGKTLDRIDNDKGYEPGNCRWATPREQAANRRPRRPRAVVERAREQLARRSA